MVKIYENYYFSTDLSISNITFPSIYIYCEKGQTFHRNILSKSNTDIARSSSEFKILREIKDGR